jgi:hypothetical protein
MPSDLGFEEAVLERILGQVDAMVDGMAGTMGTPPGAQKYSQREQEEMWNASPVADPEQRAQQMMQMYQQGIAAGTDPKALVEQITDQVYPNRRKLIESGRPRIDDQITYAKQMERQLARRARDQGVHIPGVEPWASITQENAPPEPEMIEAEPVQASSVPGWAEPGGQFGLTGVMP